MSVATRDMDRSAGIAAAGPLKNAVLIAGPTASGKSALALEFARRTGGMVINADSMQVYSVLSVITARPTSSDMAMAPHRLYGHVSPSQAYSTGKWMRDVAGLVASGELVGRVPIFVGGTGLYFRALTEGLSPMPEVPAELRQHWRERLENEGSQALHGVLAARDKNAAGSIRPGDSQRILRALEVLEASGRPLGEWHAERSQPLVDMASALMVILEPERGLLAQRIENRFDRMVEEGALEEARVLAEMRITPAMPAMKAIGVRELIGVLEGRSRLDEAMTRAKTATRRYAKRQMTWFRHQAGPQWTRTAISDDGCDAPELYRRISQSQGEAGR